MLVNLIYVAGSLFKSCITFHSGYVLQFIYSSFFKQFCFSNCIGICCDTWNNFICVFWGTGTKVSLRCISSVQLLSCVQLFVTPWAAAQQASLSITNSWRLLKLMSIESVMPSNHLNLCCPFFLLPSIFASIRVFSNESSLASSSQSIGVSASASVLPMNIQD